MNIESITSALSGAKYVKSAAPLPVTESKNAAVHTSVSGDIVTLGADVETEYPMYTNNGYSFHVTGTDISEGKEMTDDEKWDAIISKYSGKPFKLNDYGHMLCDLEAADLITFDERCAATSHAIAVVGDKTIEYDMRDGELWNEDIPASLYMINFDELFADLSNENRIYEGYTASNDPRPFLSTFYTKMSNYFRKDTNE